MVAPNLTDIAANASNIATFTKATSDVLLNGMLGVFLLIIVAAITLIGFISSTGDFGRSLMAASAITLVLALLLAALGLIAGFVLFMVLIICGIAIAIAVYID